MKLGNLRPTNIMISTNERDIQGDVLKWFFVVLISENFRASSRADFGRDLIWRQS